MTKETDILTEDTFYHQSVMLEEAVDALNIKEDGVYVDTTFEFGANLYVRKPSSFNEIKGILSEVLQKNWDLHNLNLNKENFVYDLSTY